MRYYYAGDRHPNTYLSDPFYMLFDDNDPKVKIFSSKKARDAYVEGSNACTLPARIARKWIDAYTWEPIHARGYAKTMDDYLRRYPRNNRC